MPAKRQRRAIACLAAAAAPTTKALRLGGLRRPRPPPSIPRAGAETVAEHIAEDPRHTEAMREEVVVSSAMTARECVRRVREAPASWGRSGRVWVNGQDGRFAGYVGASQLLLAEPDASLAFLAKPPEAVLRADEDLDDALARVVNRGGSGALPVVDSNGALVGALAPGEVMVELEQAVTEDVARYAATGAGESYFGSRIQDLVCARGAWLAALLVLQSASSVVLGKFEGLLQRHLALALFLTMLTGTAGNAGNQTSALVIRGLATGEIRAGRDWRRVLWRETRVALPLSIALGLAAFGRVVAAVPGRMAVRTAGVVAFATTSTILAAILVGVGAPLLLDAVGVDPCNCASPALATAVDLLGVVFLCVTGQRFLK